MERDETDRQGTAGLPAGTVTFVLGDVVGSTRLWEEHAAVMPGVLARFDQLIDETLAAAGGARPAEQGEGDNFVAAFAKAADAVAFAAAVQRQLATEVWPGGVEVRLRMALHTGDARQRDGGRYMGEALNRCARLRALGHGGQVLLSATTAELVVAALGGDVFLRDLGAHHLRDLSRPERVSQLCGPGLGFEFPPLRSLDRMPNNLPVQVTSFVGRAGELAETSLILADRRLLTLVGAGGCGKTRLAVQLAAEVVDRYPDGVWFADLAALADPELVPAALAGAVGVAEIAGQPLVDTVAEHLADQEALVVLDNCEHLLDACVAVAERLLRTCSAVRILATSREPLGAGGETIYRVPPLGLPAGETDAGCESVTLFAERVALARPTLLVGAAEVAAMAAICTRLDGIPLAIELAAARCGALTPAQIAERLESHFDLLTGRSRSALPRQRALEASIDWSYGLLTDEERLLLARLSVFAGGFTLEAAEAVAAGGSLDGWAVVDRLTSLIDKSLVQEAAGSAQPRYRLLETVRQYAAAKLVSAGEAGAVRRRHAEHYVAWVEALEDGLYGPEMVAVCQALEADLDNLRAADDWAAETGEADVALRLASPLRVFWPMHVGEGSQRVGRALGLSGGSPSLRARALGTAAECSCHLGDLSSVDAQAGEAIGLLGDAPDEELHGELIALRSWGKFFGGDDSGAELAVEAVARLRLGTSLRAQYCLTDALWCLGIVSLARGCPAEAEAQLEEALRAARRLGSPLAVGRSLMLLGLVHSLDGNFEAAEQFLAEARPVMIAAEDDLVLLAECSAAWVAGARGDVPGALIAGRAAAAEARRRQQFVVLGWGGLLSLALLEVRSGADPGSVQAGLEEAEAMMTATGFAWGAAHCRALQAEVLLAGGDLGGARRAAESALEVALASLSGRRGRGPAELALARVARAEGDPGTAEDTAHRALATLAEAGMRLGAIEALELLAALAADGGRAAEAARLLGAAGAARDRIGYVPAPAEATRLAADLDRVRAALAGDVFEATWEKASAMSLDEAVASASRGRGPRRRPTSGWASLTPTELEVTGLVAQGLRNGEIAAKLFVSPETVKTHVSNVLAKLGVANRTELAALASRRT